MRFARATLALPQHAASECHEQGKGQGDDKKRTLGEVSVTKLKVEAMGRRPCNLRPGAYGPGP